MQLNSTLLIIVFLTLVLWILATNVLLIRLLKYYQRLMRGVRKKELRELLENVNEQLKRQKKTNEELQKWLEKLELNQENHVQKVGFIRFNPFTDTGGNQSFCLAMLDGHDEGIVISSLHSREQTRLYAKSVSKGKTKGQELSREEKEALKRAQTKG